jgi:ABC-type lipoprotein release transport system permease subunit
VTLIIAAFSYLQAVTDSALNTMSATGDPLTIMVLSQAAESETVSGMSREESAKLELTPGAVHGQHGALLSPEMVAISSARTDEGSDMRVNTAVRGVDFDAAGRVRHGRVRILEGRPPRPGVHEVIVGEAASRLYLDHHIGDRVPIGTRGIREFEVVGIFTTGGTAADSEIWGDVEVLRDVYGRERYSSVRLLAESESAAREAIDYVTGPSVGLKALTERTYFSALNTDMRVTQILSLAMIIIMGVAAAFAVANTMYSAVAGRATEIGMLRAIGFGRTSILLGFVVEGLALCLAGGLLGIALSFVCHGWQRNMLPQTFTTVSYSLAITPKIMFVSLAVALAIGLLGTIMPAWKAARLTVIGTLREA